MANSTNYDKTALMSNLITVANANTISVSRLKVNNCTGTNVETGGKIRSRGFV